MEFLFASGRMAALILALTGIEGIALLLYRQRTGRGVAARDLLPMLLAGAGLLAAMWAALAGAAWPLIAAFLLAALLAHLVDLSGRWRN